MSQTDKLSIERKRLGHSRLQTLAQFYGAAKLSEISKTSKALLDSSLRTERAVQDLSFSAKEIERLQEESNRLQQESNRLQSESAQALKLQAKLLAIANEQTHQRDQRDQAEKAVDKARKQQEELAVNMLFALSREATKALKTDHSTVELVLLLTRLYQGLGEIDVNDLSKLDDKRFHAEVEDQLRDGIAEVEKKLSKEDKADIKALAKIEMVDEWVFIKKISEAVRLLDQNKLLIKDIKAFAQNIGTAEELMTSENLEIKPVIVTGELPIPKSRLTAEYPGKAIEAEYTKLEKAYRKNQAQLTDLLSQLRKLK